MDESDELSGLEGMLELTCVSLAVMSYNEREKRIQFNMMKHGFSAHAVMRFSRDFTECHMTNFLMAY